MMDQRILKAMLLLAALAPSVAVRDASAQTHPNDFSIGGFIGGQLANAGQSMQQLRAHKAAWAQEIAAARQRYWAAYPAGSGLAAAEQELAALLWEKDLYALHIAAADRKSYGSARGGVASIIEQLTGGAVDAGITPAAKDLFEDWVNAVLESSTMQIAGNAFVTPAAIAADRSAAAYGRYQRVRDLWELLRGPRSPLAATDGKEYLSSLLVVVLHLPTLGDGRQHYDAIVRALGEPVMNDAAPELMRLRDARRQGSALRNGPLLLQRVAQAAAEKQRSTNDDRLYVLMTIAVVSSTNHDWVKAHRAYDDLVSRYGTARLHAVAQRLRALPAPFVCVSGSSMSCFDDIFARGEDAFLGEATVAAERARSNADAAAAREARFTNADDEFMKTAEYWNWKSEQLGWDMIDRPTYIYSNRWKHIASPSLRGDVRAALSELDQLFLQRLAFVKRTRELNGIVRNPSSWAQLSGYIEERLVVLRDACKQSNEDGETCQLLTLAEAALRETPVK